MGLRTRLFTHPISRYRSRGRKPNAFRPTVEALEERQLPSTFSNLGLISIPSKGAASPNPSTISVSGLTGHAVARVSVTLNDLTHSYPEDIDIMLVGPGGERVVLLSDCGGSLAANDLTITFDDAAATVPAALVTGTFRPTNLHDDEADIFPSGPVPSGARSLATFIGTNPNGAWQLFVVDDTTGDTGEIAGGWTLTLETTDKFVNLGPSAPTIDLSTNEDTAKSSSVFPIAHDPDGTPQKASFTAPATAKGTLVSNANGTFTFTPAADFTGVVSIPYTISPSQPQLKKIASPVVAEEQLGWSVAVSGDTAIVGAFSLELNAFDFPTGNYAENSAVYVFGRTSTGWVQQQRFNRSDASGFGAAVAIEGDTFLVGAPAENDFTGAVYVYTRSGGVWTQSPVPLVASDGDISDYFGSAVAISGDKIVVGAFNEDHSYIPILDIQLLDGFGAAYLFRKVGTAWSQEFKFVSEYPEDMGYFGAAVAIDGETVVIGAPLETAIGVESGAVYIYSEDYNPVANTTTWQFDRDLLPTQAGERLGSAVAIDGNTIVAGAMFANPLSENQYAGAAYVSTRSGGDWGNPKRITGDVNQAARFGASVSVSGDRVIVGAPLYDGDAVDSGAVYVFRPGGASWIREQRLLAADMGEDDRFGFSTAISGDTLLVGAPRDDGGQLDTGAVYFLELGMASGTINLTVAPVNDPPEFTASAPPPVAPGAGPQNLPFASQIRPGPVTAVDEASQSLTFTVTVLEKTGSLDFLTAPKVDEVTGNLSFETLGMTSGTATLEVSLSDGFTATVETVTLTVADIVPPEIGTVADVTVYTTGSSTVAYWAAPTATDALSPTVVLTADATPGVTPFALGDHVVTYTASDASGNQATRSFTVHVRPMITFTDTDNDTYTVKLAGAGQVSVILDNGNGNGRGAIERIFVADTQLAKSVLTVAVKKVGDGIVKIDTISDSDAGGLKSISAKTADLNGAGVNLTGPLGSITIRNTAGGADIWAGNTTQQPTTIVAGVIGSGTAIAFNGAITSFTAASVGAASIAAASIGKITTTGSFNANLDVAGSVGAVKVGSISDAVWRVLGQLGSITSKGDFNGLDIKAGGQPTQTTKFTANNLGDGTRVELGSTLAAVTVTNAADGIAFVAPAITKLTAKADFRADLNLSGIVDSSKPTLGKAAITGVLADADWTITGNVGTLTAKGGIRGFTFTTNGLLKALTASTIIDGSFRAGTITTVKVTGAVEAFANSNLTAKNFGKATFTSVKAGNGGVKFGVTATSILAVAVKTPPFKYDPNNPNPQFAVDFRVQVVAAV